MLKNLLQEQQEYLNFFFKEVDLSSAEVLLDRLAELSGVVFFTGVGKSGLIAKKAAVTMTSIGTKALYLSPTNALHGDIAMVTQEDFFIFFSKSGESDELIHLLPYLRNKKVPLAAVVSNPKSRLAQGCDIVVHLPVLKELCPYDLAPTTSTTEQMIFGDLLAIALMKRKNIPLDQFQLNHPAGRIGKRLQLKVKDLMLTGESLPLCYKEDHLVDLLVELSNKRCGCLLVVDQQMNLEGIFTDGDLRRSLLEYGSSAMDKQVGDLMKTHPRTIDPDLLATEAVRKMESKLNQEITVLPVVDSSGKLKGLIKMHDILQSGI